MVKWNKAPKNSIRWNGWEYPELWSEYDNQ